jgi:hypothetical protein
MATTTATVARQKGQALETTDLENKNNSLIVLMEEATILSNYQI